MSVSDKKKTEKQTDKRTDRRTHTGVTDGHQKFSTRVPFFQFSTQPQEIFAKNLSDALKSFDL